MTIKCSHCGTLHSIDKKIVEAQVPLHCLKCGKEMHHKGFPLKEAHQGQKKLKLFIPGKETNEDHR